jgi:S1-C subfamily serine protease
MKICKPVFFIILLFAGIFYSFPEDITTEQIFDNYNSSVVYISHSIFFDSKLVKNPDLFEKVEKSMNKKFIDDYFPLSSGSGFIITNDGYIITNNHIFDLETEEDLKSEASKNSLYNYLVSYFNDTIPLSLMNDIEFKKFKEDLHSLAFNSDVKIQVKVENSKNYSAKMIKNDKKIDLAVLKINSDEKNFNTILIGDSNDLKVGQKIIALGYPLPDKFGFLKDFKATLTEGTISALRTDDYGIQHTASVNPGNSGGPLISANGEVVGINTAVLKNAAGINFSITTAKIKDWLSSVSMGNLILQNKDEAVKISPRKYDANGNLIVSQTLNIKKSKYKIYLDNKFVADSPYLLRLPEGLSSIRMESASDYSEEKVFADKKIKDVYFYSPAMTKFTGKITVTSSQGQAEVYINDSLVGKTPYHDDDINIGEIKLKIKLDGYLTKEDKITVTKNGDVKYNANLEKSYKIIFKSELPDDAEVTLTNATNEKLSYKKADIAYIKKGKWKLNIKGNSFTEINKDIEVLDKDYEFADSFDIIKTVVKLNNLKDGSKILVDNKDYAAKMKNSSFELNSGEYELVIRLDGYNDFRKKIVVTKDENIEINVTYVKSVENIENYLYGGNTCVVFGAIITTYAVIALPVGIYNYINYKTTLINPFAMMMYSTESAYRDATRSASLGVLISGAVALTIGLGLFGGSIPLYVYYHKNYALSINIYQRENDLGLEFVFLL